MRPTTRSWQQFFPVLVFFLTPVSAVRPQSMGYDLTNEDNRHHLGPEPRPFGKVACTGACINFGRDGHRADPSVDGDIDIIPFVKEYEEARKIILTMIQVERAGGFNERSGMDEDVYKKMAIILWAVEQINYFLISTMDALENQITPAPDSVWDIDSDSMYVGDAQIVNRLRDLFGVERTFRLAIEFLDKLKLHLVREQDAFLSEANFLDAFKACAKKDFTRKQLMKISQEDDSSKQEELQAELDEYVPSNGDAKTFLLSAAHALVGGDVQLPYGFNRAFIDRINLLIDKLSFMGCMRNYKGGGYSTDHPYYPIAYMPKSEFKELCKTFDEHYADFWDPLWR
mmetsp:Transcript_10532/g.19105  ORF Transcript_10532/g.19105 Transcript_10532/m.19105 type:complete len:342 (-) Transcript_10532:104-1129(-)